MRRTATRAFTLIEILIVVVILGILAAIVIPQFSDASEDAAESSAQSQLQTVRSQIELFRVQDQGTLPDFANDGWDSMTDPAHANNPTGQRYLQQAPRNPVRANATGIVVADLDPGAASGGAATDGWVWNNVDEQLYAIDADGNVANW